MSAANALRAHAGHTFSEYFTDLLKRNEVNVNKLTKLIWGKDERGNTRNSGNMYQIASGKRPMSEDFAVKLAPFLKVSAEELLRANEPVRAAHHRRTQKSKRHVGAPPPGPPALLPTTSPTPAPRFSLTVDGTGRATLSLNLKRVPLEAALRVVTAVTAARVLAPTPQLALSHETVSVE